MKLKFQFLNFITSQATIQGFENKGYSLEESENLLRKSVEIACEARELYYRRCREASTGHTSDNRVLKQRKILVAASVGSYGAYLADGSEYRYIDTTFLATTQSSFFAFDVLSVLKIWPGKDDANVFILAFYGVHPCLQDVLASVDAFT